MPKKNLIKTYSQLSIVQMLLFIFAGMGIATAGWYYSDRLDINFGQPSGINLVREWSGQGRGQCDPNSTPIKTRQIKGCDVVTTTEKCVPMPRHYHTSKTWSGLRVSEVSNPNKRTISVTNYEQSKSESRREIKQEMDEYMEQMKNKRGIELTTMRKEYENMRAQARLNRCQVN